jgi:hypothetical protein
MLGEALLFPFLFTEILTIPCGRLTNRLGFGFMGEAEVQTNPTVAPDSAEQIHGRREAEVERAGEPV